MFREAIRYPDNCPNEHDPKRHNSEEHNPEWTHSQMHTLQNGQHLAWTPSRMDTVPNRHDPE